MLNSRSLRLLVAISIPLFAPLALCAQLPDPITTAQAPVPGVGHHYVGIGAEIVNPADGSISFELPIQTPPGRQLSFPFGIRFSSSELFSISNNNNGWFYWMTPPAPPFQLKGWSYELPTVTGVTVVTESSPDPSGYGTDYCLGSANLVFRGFQGAQALGTINEWPYTPPPANHPLSCWASRSSQSSILIGDNAAVATLPPPLNDSNQQPLSVVDRAGTTYQFPALAAGFGSPTPWGLLAQTVTDRNGNQITLSGANDLLGRQFAAGQYFRYTRPCHRLLDGHWQQLW